MTLDWWSPFIHKLLGSIHCWHCIRRVSLPRNKNAYKLNQVWVSRKALRWASIDCISMRRSLTSFTSAQAAWKIIKKRTCCDIPQPQLPAISCNLARAARWTCSQLKWSSLAALLALNILALVGVWTRFCARKSWRKLSWLVVQGKQVFHMIMRSLAKVFSSAAWGFIAGSSSGNFSCIMNSMHFLSTESQMNENEW